jgi:beta-galactosidase
VEDEYVPYIMPQEYGHHTDVRWLTLTDENGQGLKILGKPTFEFNVSHFSSSDIFQCTHTIDLKHRPEVILSIDARMRGLGTASCGPDTLANYQIRNKTYRFMYGLQVI